MRKRNAKSAAGLYMQSTGKLLQNWSFKRYRQHMKWYGQEPRIIAYLYSIEAHRAHHERLL